MTRKKIYLIAIVLIACLVSYIGFIFFLQSRSKVTIVMATNYLSSGEFHYATRAKAFFEQHGINFKNVETQGSRDNFELLNDPKSDVNAALILRGVLAKEDTTRIVSLGAVGIEAIWIFYRSTLDKPPVSLREIANLSVLVASSGSGSYVLTKKLFDGVAIDIENNKNFSQGHLTSQINDFVAGKGDVLIFASGLNEHNTRKLFFEPQIKIYQLEPNTDFYERTGLNVIILPKASVNEAANIPDRDVRLVASYRILAVKKDLPAEEQTALLIAARKLIARDQFEYTVFRSHLPAPVFNSEFEMSKVAMKFYKDGPPYLTQFFPEWLSYTIFD